MSKNEDINQIVKIGPGNASAFLLAKIHTLEDSITSIKDELAKEPAEDVAVEKTAMRLAAKLATLEKGNDGHTPTKEELLSLITPLIPEVSDGVDGETPTEEDLLALIKPLIPVVKNGKDGVTPIVDVEQIVRDVTTQVIPLIPTVDTIEKDIPQLGEEIRDSLELLEGKERLNMSAIDGLIEALEALKKRIEEANKVLYVGGGSTGGGRIVRSYDLSTLLNGTTTTFSLPAFYRVISVHLSSFPNILRPDVDYTTDVNTSSITFTAEITASTSLASGQTCIITYSEA